MIQPALAEQVPESSAPPPQPELPPPFTPAPPLPSSRPVQPRHPGPLQALQSFLYVLVSSLFVITFILQPIRIPSPSMEPTLLVGDFLLMDKQVVFGRARGLLPPAVISRGDVVVFHDPVDDPAVHLVKRVIAAPGDRIRLHNGVVYRNGIALREEYTIHRPAAADPFRDDFPELHTMDARANPRWWIRLRGLVHDGEVTVPPRSYFVMGDNRNDSEDSRYWGFVPRDAIVGRPLLVYFSWRQPDDESAGPSPAPALPPAHGPQGWAAWSRWERVFHVIR